MSLIESMTSCDSLLIDKFSSYNHDQMIYFSMSECQNGQNHYFFRLFGLNEEQELICQGYLYCTMNHTVKESRFIGTFIRPEYRNNGLSSLLISTWIKFCFDNNYQTLSTTHRQRKPFLLYQLKQYAFELRNISLYQTSKNCISICKRANENHKLLLFHDEQLKNIFSEGSIIAHDNYQIIDELDDQTSVLDQVVLHMPYHLQDNNIAYKRSLDIYQKHKN